MKCEMVSNFKGNINGVNFSDEQSYNLLKDFIENIEEKFNLNINNKEATEFIQNQLYEETEYEYNMTGDYEEAHNNAMNNLTDNVYILKELLKYKKSKINI